jgi:small multidrug resistance pump
LGIPVAVTYAIWSAGGIVLVTIAARVFFRDPINLLTGLGMLVIILGVALTAVGSAQQH